MRLLRALLLLVAAATAPAAEAQAQRVEMRGRGDIDNDVFLRELLRRPDLVVIADDTLIARTDTVSGTVLVVLATARIEGVIAGDLVIVDGNVFLRPSARVLGRVHNVAGGYYPSELAQVGGARSEPNAEYRAERAGERILIIGTAQQSILVLDGLFGFQPPTYDRVDGVALGFGAGLLLPRIGRLEPLVRGHVEYRSQRGTISGGAELSAARGRTDVAFGAERTTRTNERWIRGDLNNSANFLFTGKDNRDYYEADRIYATIGRALEEGPRTTSVFIRGELEDSRTLVAGSPWTAFGTPREDNIAVDDGRIASVTAGTRLDWTHPRHIVSFEGALEAAGRVLDADHAFNRYVVDAEWVLATFRNHSLEFELHFQGPLPGTDSLPRQRWSFVGGSGTLQTFEFAEFRGDRVALVETQYSIPLPQRLRLPLLGAPTLDLLHAVGMAWTAEQRRSFEQNVGVRLLFSVVFLRLMADPDEINDVKFSVGLSLPRRPRPWQEDGPE